MAKIKVVHYCSVWLEITQTWLYNQVCYLPESIENHIVCRSTKNLDQFAVRHINALKEQRFGLYLLLRLQRLFGRKNQAVFFQEKIEQIRPDIIHSHFGNNGWAVMKAVEEYGAPHFVTFYGQDVGKLPKDNPVWVSRYQTLFDSAQSRFLCEGPHMAKCLIEMGCPPGKVQVHHLGIEVDKIDFQARQWQKGEVLKVLIAASFREKKGIPYALEALGRVHQEIPLEITLIGDADSSKEGIEEKEKIQAVLKRNELLPVTKMLGYCSQKILWQEAYRNHLFLSPSVTAGNGDTEGGAPVSLIEMAASGMPIVSSFHCDIPSVIKDGKTGWLAEERNVDAIVTSLYRWIEDPDGWPEMLRAGRQHIERNYDARVQGQTLARYYQESMIPLAE